LGSVLVVGSINADLVVTVGRLPQPGETVSGGSFARHGGGKGANQAVAAARAGATVRFVGAVGDDDLGQAAVAELEAEGIDASGVERRGDAATGVAAIVVDADGENQIAVAPGANALVSPGAAGRAAERLSAQDVLLMNLELGDEALLAAVSAAPGRVIVNPAPARSLPDAVLARGPLLTPNEGEALALSGEGDDPEASARVLAARTGAAVVVTLGADGVLVCLDGTVERLPAPEVEVVDTTGAGDVFSGTLAAGLADGLELRDAALRAVAAATAAAGRSGARG